MNFTTTMFLLAVTLGCQGRDNPKSSTVAAAVEAENSSAPVPDIHTTPTTTITSNRAVDSIATSQKALAADIEREEVDSKSLDLTLSSREETPESPVTSTPGGVDFDIHNHHTWDQVLKKMVTEKGEVDYQGIMNDRKELDQYLTELAAHPVEDTWSRSQKLAYWINAYNAFTVVLIVNNYPVNSIRDIDRPWEKKFISLGGESYSLNQIEHDIIRPKFKEPRIHFAVVCAAVSCPKLLNKAYLPETLDQQLDDQTRYFINQSGKNLISKDRVELSQLFKWYGKDFRQTGSIIEYLNQYSEVQIDARAKMSFAKYDWSLNE
jgi:hypothetical protein